MTPLTPKLGRPHFDPSYGVTGDPEGASWPATEVKLEASRNYWISTTRADGGPHSKPVWGVWLDGALWFGTGDSSVTGRNLARDPRVSVHLESGDDVVMLDGVVEVVKGSAAPADVDAVYKQKYPMPDEGDPEGAAWFRLSPRTALTWTEADFIKTAARWDFD
jgi:general stress protein 26